MSHNLTTIVLRKIKTVSELGDKRRKIILNVLKAYCKSTINYPLQMPNLIVWANRPREVDMHRRHQIFHLVASR